MYRICAVLAVALAIVSCRSQSPIEPTHSANESSQQETELTTSAVQVVNGRLDGTSVTVVTHAGWDTHSNESSILLAENRHAIADANKVDGILINMFKPTVSDVEMVNNESNRAFGLLRYIVKEPGYVDNHTPTMPIAFAWGDYDAAYYVLARDSGYTLVLAVSIPSSGVFAFNVSVPEGQRDSIRAELIACLQSITIDEITLNGDDLAALPNPLPFPSEDLEVATDNTPERPSEGG